MATGRRRPLSGLWGHQLDALEIVDRYLSDPGATGSALVSMPTGTGKSAVIAAIACTDANDIVLVVTPWKFLRGQMIEYLNEGFWVLVGDSARLGVWTGTAKALMPGSAEASIAGAPAGTALVTTTAALQQIHEKRPVQYAALAKRTTLVLVDEGHREPAPAWSKAVRGLGKPTILFTATPYRNDYHLFDVDPRNSFRFSHQEAVAERFIRSVAFEPISFGRDPSTFGELLTGYVDGPFQALRPLKRKEPRILVRCESFAEVIEVSRALRARGKSVIAIHERLENPDILDWNHVPPSSKQVDAEYWVHQWKLLEGIDDVRFSLLAIFGEFRNGRSLIQQVGRILRNPERLHRQIARVLYEGDAVPNQKGLWNAYVRYDASDPKATPGFNVREYLADLLPLQPPADYIGGTFRTPFHLDSVRGGADLRIRASASVFHLDKSFDLDAFTEGVSREWREYEDLEQLSSDPLDDDTRLHIYIRVANSPFLTSGTFLEPALGYTIYRRVGDMLFYQDSNGLIPMALAGSKRVPPDVLQRLFAGAQSRITRLSARNSDIGKHSIRARSIYAYSLEETAPGLAEHAEFVTTADAYITQVPQRPGIRRYVGLSRARVSDDIVLQSAAAFVTWVDEIAIQLSAARTSISAVFGRFAQLTSSPVRAEARNILVDLGDASRSFHSTNGSGILDVEDSCRDVGNGRFSLTANDTQYDVGITYERDVERYRLTSPKLDADFSQQDGSRRSSGPLANLVGYMNHEQAFRVIPESAGYFYSHGDWYAPRNRFAATDILIPVKQLKDYKSEKGLKCVNQTWEAHSLFHLVDSLGQGTLLHKRMKNADILVCDDLGTEIADFIFAELNPGRVVYIHAKAWKTQPVSSAKELQEVCAQAVKSASWIHPYLHSTPPNLKRWERDWNIKGVGNAGPRVRRGGLTGQASWEKIEELVRSPATSREVWVLLGNGVSHRALTRNNPPPHALQASYLLQSAWGAISSSGARLSVFCSE